MIYYNLFSINIFETKKDTSMPTFRDRIKEDTRLFISIQQILWAVVAQKTRLGRFIVARNAASGIPLLIKTLTDTFNARTRFQGHITRCHHFALGKISVYALYVCRAHSIFQNKHNCNCCKVLCEQNHHC